MADNILSLNIENLAVIMNAFDLASEEGYETRALKIASICIYGLDKEQEKEDWSGIKVKLFLTKLLNCTKIELLHQF